MDDRQADFRGLRPRWSRPLRYSSDKARCNRAPSVGQICLLGRGHAMEETQKQPPLLPRLGDGWFGGISSTRTATLRIPEPRRYECDCEILIMTPVHRTLSREKWQSMGLNEQLANIGSEVGRITHWQRAQDGHRQTRLSSGR